MRDDGNCTFGIVPRPLVDLDIRASGADNGGGCDGALQVRTVNTFPPR